MHREKVWEKEAEILESIDLTEASSIPSMIEKYLSISAVKLRFN